VMIDDEPMPDTSQYTTNSEPGYEDEDYTADENRESTITDTPSTYSRFGEYLVLAGSYRYKGNAETEVRRLQRLGYSQAEATLFNRGAYATVLVDRFSSLAEARELVRELSSQHGIEAYVHEKRGSQ